MRIRQSRQILIIFFLPALLAMALLAWFLRIELHDWAVERWSADHYAFADSLGDRINNDIAEASNLLRYTAQISEFASLPAVNQIDPALNGIPLGVEGRKRQLLEALKTRGDFSVLFVLTPNGDHYLSHPFSVQRSVKKYNLSDRAYFQEATRTKELVVSNSFIGADNIPAVAIDVPILDAQGNIVAHLGGVRYLYHLSEMLDPLRIAPFDHASLTDRQGKRIADNGPYLLWNHLDSAPPIFSDSPLKSDRHASSVRIQSLNDSNGVAWLSFRRTLDVGWELQLLRRMNSLQDEVSPQIRYTMWIGAGIVLLTSLIGAAIALRFSRRWQQAAAALKQANEALEQRVAERTAELERSEVRHRTMFESTADTVLLFDNNGLIDCNGAALRMFGATNKSDIISFHIADLSAPIQANGADSRTLANHQVAQTFELGNLTFEWIHKKLESGDTFHTEVLLTRLDLNNKPLVQATIRDISERKHTEERILTLSQAIEQSPVSVVITNTEGHIEYVNRTFEEVTGYSEAEVIGQNSRLLKSGRTPPRRYHELWQAISTGASWQGEFQNKRKNGDIFWEQVHIAPVMDNDGEIRHFLGVKQDVTHQKLQEERILHQAHFDSLTDLPNRFLALNRLEQMIKESKRDNTLIAVLFLDLDDFKKVNDSLGHEIGDKLLQHAASRLLTAVREEDTVGRLGGDEFIVLLGGLNSLEDAQPVADKLLNCFAGPFRLDNREFVVTASVGIAVYPDNGDSPAELLRNADTAMYHSKEQGCNTFSYFTQEMNQCVSRRLNLEEQLRGALENDELTIYYQPLVDIKSRSVIGAEALLRWNNSSLGMVSPEEFIPVAEQTGLIVPIGQYVLSKAIAMAAQWGKQSALPFKIAVNLSPRQFRDTGLVQFIAQTLQISGVKGSNLELEITEGVLMGGHNYIDDALNALCKMGVGIAMDDFGTGYSSLSYLRSYPFDTLKIDRSFVNDINVDSADRELVNAAIAMAHGLGLKVVAEGVETEAQLLHLATRHCDIAQGYLFSKPVPPEEITPMLKQIAA